MLLFPPFFLFSIFTSVLPVEPSCPTPLWICCSSQKAYEQSDFELARPPPTPLPKLEVKHTQSLLDEHLRIRSSYECNLLSSSGQQSVKNSVGKSEPDTKGREKFTTPPVQSEDRRKRMLRSDPEGAPPESRRRLEELRRTEEAVSTSSDLASESEDEEEETEWDQGEDGDRLKQEDGREGGKQGRGGDTTQTRGDRAGRVHNGRAVIQQLKSVVTQSSLPASPSIKTEHEGLTAGGRWGSHAQTSTQHTHTSQPQPPSHAHTPSSSLNGGSPTTPIPDSSSSSDAPAKGLFTPPSPALSPAMSVSSPQPREDRAGGRTGGGNGPDFELLQRLAGGAAGRVLFHPLALGPQGPQSLYAPSTIRYAPPELPPSHHHSTGHGDGLQLRSDHHKGPPPTFFPHLQRLAGLPPFSGFSPSDSPFSSGLPFCMNGLRGAAGSEED